VSLLEVGEYWQQFTFEPEDLDGGRGEFNTSAGEQGEQKFVGDKILSGEYVVNRPPKKPGGEATREVDKVSGGEYILQCPPKKPGGICCVLAPNCKEGSGMYLLHRPSKKLGSLLLFGTLFSGAIKFVEYNKRRRRIKV